MWGRCFWELLELARSHLRTRIRCREDEEDDVQSMYKSFCIRQRREILDDPGLRKIAIWKLEGCTNAEIAERLECTVRTVGRKLGRIRAYWGSATDER